MDNIIFESTKYAKITTFKNYCLINEKENLLHQQNILRDHFLYGPTPSFRSVYTSEKYKNKKTKYIHSKDDEMFNLSYAKLGGNSVFFTNKDRHIKNHYGNPFSEISVTTIERTLKIKDDKIIIRVYRKFIVRDFNSIYFKEYINIRSLSINLKNGDFIVGDISKSPKKAKQTKFRKNSFLFLQNITSSHIFGLPTYEIHSDKIKHFFNEFYDSKFFKKILETLNYDINTDLKLYDVIMLKFVELKKIKIPNNHVRLLTEFYPTEKFLRKNDRKLVASVLDYFGIKSKITIKLLHDVRHIKWLPKLCYLLGDNFSKYIGSLNTEHLTTFIPELTSASDIRKQILSLKNHGFLIKDIEKENLIKIVNSLSDEKDSSITNFFNDIWDHFGMIKTIREFDPELVMKSKNYRDYKKEHQEFSKVISAIKKGWTTEYQFNEKMVKEVEEPIEVDIKLEVKTEKITFYPYILKREDEYIEEGSFMHHCVASYSEKEKSIIISIRNNDASDRITCEFSCQSGICLQSRHFCNAEPPGDMVLALDKLKTKVKYYASRGLLHSSEKRKVPIKINGIEIKPEIVRASDLVDNYLPLPY